jgi:hypothetical protein
VRFHGGAFFGPTPSFEDARFNAGRVHFDGVVLSGGTVNFRKGHFDGAAVIFDINFRGGSVDLREPSSWEIPPVFGGGESTGFLLPNAKDRSRNAALHDGPSV